MLDKELVDIAAGRSDRLLISMPPRHGKTQLCCEYFIPWYLETFPTESVMYCSATDSMADKKSRVARGIVANYGAKYWGRGLDPLQRSVAHWKLAYTGPEQGECMSAGIGSGRIMGSGCTILIIDDFYKDVGDALSDTIREAQREWYLSTSSTRLAPHGAVILFATRWHKGDLYDFVKQAEADSGKEWREVKLPAICEDPENDPMGRELGEALWPERWSLEKLQRERKKRVSSGYGWQWDALYQQDPPEVLDSEFAQYLGAQVFYEPEEVPRDDIICRVMALDPSLGKTDKSDYSAIVWGELDRRGHFWVDADVKRRSTQVMVDDAVALHRWFNPHGFGCEAVGFQELLEPLFHITSKQQNVMMNYYGLDNTVAKVTRIRTLTPYLAQGKLHFRRDSEGIGLLMEQLKGFPGHKYDDGPDALEMMVRLGNALINRRAAM